MCYFLGITARSNREENFPPSELWPHWSSLTAFGLSALDCLGLIHNRIMIFFFFNGRKKRQNKTVDIYTLLSVRHPLSQFSNHNQTPCPIASPCLQPSAHFWIWTALKSGWRIPEEKNEMANSLLVLWYLNFPPNLPSTLYFVELPTVVPYIQCRLYSSSLCHIQGIHSILSRTRTQINSALV